MKLEGVLRISITIIGMAMVIYQFLGVFYPVFDPLNHINTHLIFALALIFLPALLSAIQKGEKRRALMNAFFLVVAVAGTGYVFLFSVDLQIRTGLPTLLDIVIGVLLLATVLEANRVSTGWALSIFGLLFLAYALFGHYLPHPLYHLPVRFSRMISWLSISVTTGIYSNLLYISSNVIFLYVMFSSVLEITRAQEFFQLLGKWLGNRMRGGTAQAAVISSALVGSITGAASANVVITGSVTIPSMKKAGYRAEFAGAVEAIASSGGLLMPPVMGAVAFMMVSLTGLTYNRIILAAVVPALLYYLSVGASVFFHAGKNRIGNVEQEVDTKLLLRLSPLFVIPFFVLIVLLALQFSAAYAAAWALIVGLSLSLPRKETRPTLKQFVAGLVRGAKTASIIAVMMALGGVFVSVMSVTALGPKVVGVVEAFSHGYLPLVLFFTMLASLLLGCAVPMSGGYLIVALLVGPILKRCGLEVIQAHFFALYFSVIGFLTPPVAPAALVASGISGGSFLKTALNAIKLATPCYLVPYLFCYDRSILGEFGSGIFSGMISILVATVFVLTICMLMFDYYLTKIGWVERGLGILSAVGNVLYFFAQGGIPALGIVWICFAVLNIVQIMKARETRKN
ncbi:MAG: TRAP transporter fused permease subunit [Deltaproteobacteria bacterium]|nr:TRAP transporter fused permease subunit [Deltaproteobacteria bacterium]